MGLTMNLRPVLFVFPYSLHRVEFVWWRRNEYREGWHFAIIEVEVCRKEIIEDVHNTMEDTIESELEFDLLFRIGAHDCGRKLRSGR